MFGNLPSFGTPYPNMRITILICVGLLASYWVDVCFYDGAYTRAADAVARNVAKRIVIAIRQSV
jgi:hypothetical protein